MIKRIDLFMPPNVSQYGVLHHFTKKIHEAFQRIGIFSRILEAQRDNPKPFLTELFKDPPDCTFSLNGLLPDSEGRFFCDLIQIPHVAYVVDSPNGYSSLSKSHFTIVASVDRNAVDFFKGIHCKHTLFMPHGVEKNLGADAKDKDRTYDVLMLSSCIDYERIREDWHKKYSPELASILEDAAEQTLDNPGISYVQGFAQAMDKNLAKEKKVDLTKIDFLEALDELEMYIRGKERVELVRSIHDARVDVFGSSASTTSWKNQLKGQKNVIVHDDVPFDQALELMQKSKIVLNSCAWIKNGIHERILSGLACGALVVTEANTFMAKGGHFKDGANICLYQYKELNKVNDMINYYLADEPLRQKVALAGREVVMQHYTWDHLCGNIIKELPSMINNIREEVVGKA